MTPEALSHVPIALALGSVLVALVIGILKGWAALIDTIKTTVADALAQHTEVEDVRWGEIERRLKSLEEKVDRLLMGDRP